MSPCPSRRVVNLSFVPSSSSPLAFPEAQRPPPQVAARLYALDGRDVEAALAVVKAIVAEGEWRLWMTAWLVRRYGDEGVGLACRAAPLVPSSFRL